MCLAQTEKPKTKIVCSTFLVRYPENIDFNFWVELFGMPVPSRTFPVWKSGKIESDVFWVLVQWTSQIELYRKNMKNENCSCFI